MEALAPNVNWEKVKAAGVLPEGRVGAIAERFHNHIFVFGGFVGSRRVNSCLIFDTSKDFLGFSTLPCLNGSRI